VAAAASSSAAAFVCATVARYKISHDECRPPSFIINNRPEKKSTGPVEQSNRFQSPKLVTSFPA
jgi:hypothetical protein